ncbi:MAG: methionyl-tRNA formyltransferase [Syntrophothermus sp.]
MRVIYMGTPDFAVPCLERLAQSGYDIPAVVTQPDRPRGRGQRPGISPVKASALKLGLPVYQPERVASPDFIVAMGALAPDAIVVVAFGQKIPAPLLELAPSGCINVHASLLPEYRGAAPIHRAIIDGREVTGVTTIYLDEGWDTGDIILQRKVPITYEDTVGTLHDRLAEVGAGLLLETLAAIAHGQAPRIPQDENRASYAFKLSSADAAIPWSRDAGSIYNLVRGMNPWPGAYTWYEGMLLKVWKTSNPASLPFEAQPGEILKTDQDGILVATGRGGLRLIEVQPEGGRRMSGADFARGRRLEIGTAFTVKTL